MKKINVQKLVELKQKEADNLKAQSFEKQMMEDGYRIHGEGLVVITERIKEIRFAIREESVKLNEAIKTAEGRANARTVDALGIAEALREVTNFFGISKKAMKGTLVTLDCNAQKFPSAYKWTPLSTIVYAEFTASGWCVTGIERDTALTKKFCVKLSETAKEAYLRQAVTLGE